jgi:hypothetical protein
LLCSVEGVAARRRAGWFENTIGSPRGRAEDATRGHVKSDEDHGDPEDEPQRAHPPRQGAAELDPDRSAREAASNEQRRDPPVDQA